MMLRAAGKRVLIGILLFSMIGAAMPLQARQGALLAAIVSFTADAQFSDYSAVEAGSQQVTLSWQTVNTNGQYRLALDSYQQNRWVSLLGENEALPLNGAKVITVEHPQNFGVPTYRLTLHTTRGDVIGQQFITLPYLPAVQDAPQILSFTTPAPSIDTNLLVQSNARLTVRWQIENRPLNTLIRFEQVLPDGSTISAEPSRNVLWLPSQGETAIVPRTTASKEDLHFRMSLVNALDGSVMDMAEFALPVIGNVVRAPQLVQQPNGPIQTFSAQTAGNGQGGSVTVNWDAGEAQSVQLLQQVAEEGPRTLYIELPPSGSMTVNVPEGAPATFTLRAQNAEGEVATGEVTVGSAGP